MTRHPTAVGGGLVLFACTLWGITGLLIYELIGLGLSPLQVAYYANGLAFCVLLAGLVLRAPRYLRIGWRELPLVVCIGAVGTGVSMYCWTSAVALVGVSLTALLISTAPAWVTLLAWRFLGEPVHRSRLAAVGVGFLGSALVAQVYDAGALHANAAGLAFGLICGLSNALYVVLAKVALRKQHPFTVSVYSLGATSLVLLPIQPAPIPTGLGRDGWFWLVLFAIADMLIAPLAHNAGLRRLQAGVVSVLSLWELVVALLLGALVLGESLAVPQLIGAVLIAASVFSLGLAEPMTAATAVVPALEEAPRP